jgi:hypothetical protein
MPPSVTPLDNSILSVMVRIPHRTLALVHNIKSTSTAFRYPFLHPHRSPVSLRLRNMTSRTLSWTPQCYPPTRRSDHVDVYRSGAGVEVKVSDPYDWLEKDSEEQEKWLAAQEALARNFLDAHPDRVKLEEEIRASTDYEKVSSSLMRSSDRMKRSIIVRPPHTAG